MWLPLGPRCSAPVLCRRSTVTPLLPQSHSQLFKTAVLQSTDKMAASPPRWLPLPAPLPIPAPAPTPPKAGTPPAVSTSASAPRASATVPSGGRSPPRFLACVGSSCAALLLVSSSVFLSFSCPGQIYPPGWVAFGNSGGLPFSACVLGHPGWY